MSKIKTLLLYANGFRQIDKITNTVIRGVLGLDYAYKPPVFLKKIPLLNIIVNYLLNPYEFLSYVNDWKEAFCESEKLQVEMCNIFDLLEQKKYFQKIKDYDFIVILHSAAGDTMQVLNENIEIFLKRKAKILMFIGNEYDLMDEKIGFAKNAKVEYIGSQLPIETAQWIYSELDTEILAAPHALNTEVYFDKKQKRNLDFGFRGAKYPWFIGDTERNNFFEFFMKNYQKHDFLVDIEMGKRKNLPRNDWSNLLNQSKGVLGAEAGTYFLDKKGCILNEAKKFLEKNSTISFDQYFEKFFQNPSVEYASGKAISSRHFEPIGTKTCQVLLEGYYNGILKPDIHYISVKKDFSNFEEAMQKFKDESFRTKIVEQAYEHILLEHTYKIRVEKLLKRIL